MTFPFLEKRVYCQLGFWESSAMLLLYVAPEARKQRVYKIEMALRLREDNRQSQIEGQVVARLVVKSVQHSKH